MQQFKNIDVSIVGHHNQQVKKNNLTVDVARKYQHKQIDTRWVQLKMNGRLLSRSYFGSCIQAGKVYIHGGYNEEQGILSDFYEAQFYDLPSQWLQLKVKSPKQKNPPSLRNHTLCAYTSNLILFGGQKSMLQNNCNFYKFDLRSLQWQIVKVVNLKDNKFPLSLDSHICQIYQSTLYIFGGYQSQKGIYSNRLYQVNLTNLSDNQITVSQVQLKTDQKPCPRGNFSACVIDSYMYVFGGTNSDQVFDDMWCYSLQKRQWRQVKKQEKGQWPQKRKGHIMVPHINSRSIFMFGGIKQITKQQNDIMVFLTSKSKWVRIHKSTNQLYQSSPTLKKQMQKSPQIINAKNKKQSKIGQRRQEPFRLGIKSVAVYKTMAQSHESNLYNGKSVKTQYGSFKLINNGDSPTSKKHMSVVQEKKLRQFMNRKKLLLNQVNKNAVNHQKRPHSPTSETILYSLDTIGEQKKCSEIFKQQLPKVIFDQEKGAVIGKKPCARDGHGGLAHDENIIIIGGDRHMMSFNDVYLFKMDKAIQNIYLYE